MTDLQFAIGSLLQSKTFSRLLTFENNVLRKNAKILIFDCPLGA
jgi:hypothetical protein